jgi:hypothetical protein
LCVFQSTLNIIFMVLPSAVILFKYYISGKDRVVPVLNQLSTTTWILMVEWRYISIIFDLGTIWRLVVSFTPRPHYPRENSQRYLLDRMLNGSQRRSGCYGGRETFYSCWELNPVRPARSPSLQDSVLSKSASTNVIPEIRATTMLFFEGRETKYVDVKELLVVRRSCPGS